MGLRDKMLEWVDKRHERQMDVVRAIADWAIAREKTLSAGGTRQAAVDQAARELLANFRGSVETLRAATSGLLNPMNPGASYSGAYDIISRAIELKGRPS